MTPPEIERQFGICTLERIYDHIMSIPTYELADWILSLYSPADVQKLIDSLNEE